MKGKLAITAVVSVFFAIAAYILCLQFDVQSNILLLSLLAGILFGIGLFLSLVVNGRRMEKRYRALEGNIVSPVFYQTNGNFNLGSKIRNGNIYFCENGILFALLDERPPILEELPVNRIESFAFDGVKLLIRTVEGERYIITTPDVPGVQAALQGKHWIAGKESV